MQVINARTVNEALSQGLHAIRVGGVAQPSRVGDVLRMPYPVLTRYSNPKNHVLLSQERDANPFFHLMEALWMLAGRNDLPWLTRFNKRFASYSDDGGQTQPGAYGYRWRNHFGHDQLQDVILELKRSPQSRRIVIAMWDGGSRADWQSGGEGDGDTQPGDFFAAVAGSADVPCNTHIYLDTTGGKLNMTVCCRSNDIIWGAYGANVVHFSILLEYLAMSAGLPMGEYRQFSNDYHLYTNVVPRDMLMPMSRDVERSDIYLSSNGIGTTRGVASPFPNQVSLLQSQTVFDAELDEFMQATAFTTFIGPVATDYSEPFMRGVAVPMYNAYDAFKNKRWDEALAWTRRIEADDWRAAATAWLNRRKIKAEVNAVPFVEVVPTAQEVENG